MERYILGAIREAVEKGRALMVKIPGARDLGVYFSVLATTAKNEIKQILNELDYLNNDPKYNDPSTLQQKFSRFKKLSQELSSLENTVVAAINRKSNDDEFLNKLVQEICKELNYPLQPPVASGLSQRYYRIDSFYNLLSVPLLESDFVLHLPDIYHELGHPLLSLANLDDPKVEPFQNSLGYFQVEIRRHFEAEIQWRKINKVNTNTFDPIVVWKDSWLENWAVELFCDLFATYTLGPAFVWSNLHMCVKMSSNPYNIPFFHKTEHPPNEARMRTILLGLAQIGFTDDIPAIQEKWDDFKQIVGIDKPPDYTRAVPDKLLQVAVEHCLVGIQQIKCELAKKETTDKVNRLLNDSWTVFWENPEKFCEWEKAKLKEFKSSI